VDDLIEFVVERALDHIGLDREGVRRWGQ
jgi:3-polyprenyl-4-hydroxybenzoate decarboxylase